MTSEAVVSMFSASLAAAERALAEEFTKARQAESALATAHARIHKLEMELLLARAESAQWRNRYERECELRVWEGKNRELQRGPASQQSGAGDYSSMSHTPGHPDEESEEAPAPQEPSPPATPLKPDDPTPPATATPQEPRSLIAASPTVEPVPSPLAPPATPSSHSDMPRPEEPRPPVSSPPLPSSLPHFTRTPALPRVEQIGPMAVKVYIEQERYPKAINLVGRVIGPSSLTLKSLETATGCAIRIFSAETKNMIHGPPYVLIRRDGPACGAGLAKVHDAAARLQKILTPPPHGRDELWAQQQQQLREIDAARGVRIRRPKPVGSLPAVSRPSTAVCETIGEQATPPIFGTHSTPAVARPSEERETTGEPATPTFGSRSTPAVERPSEARETTGEQATPTFGTRSEMIPQQQQQLLQPKEKQSKPPRQQQQSGQKEAPRGIWRL